MDVKFVAIAQRPHDARRLRVRTKRLPWSGAQQQTLRRASFGSNIALLRGLAQTIRQFPASRPVG